MTPPPEAQLREGCEWLATHDPALAKAYQRIGLPVWRVAPSSYATLARMIAFQQISTKAGAAIWARVEALPGEICATDILSKDDSALTACGLSRPKVRYLKAIAACEQDGSLCFDRLQTASLEAARDELLALKGIGPWTAEVFILYTLGHLDAFPQADVGLMESYKRLRGDTDRLDPKAFAIVANDWRPWRGVATHLLWGWLNAERQYQAAPTAS